jgi:hypothetical protein
LIENQSIISRETDLYNVTLKRNIGEKGKTSIIHLLPYKEKHCKTKQMFDLKKIFIEYRHFSNIQQIGASRDFQYLTQNEPLPIRAEMIVTLYTVE